MLAIILVDFLRYSQSVQAATNKVVKDKSILVDYVPARLVRGKVKPVQMGVVYFRRSAPPEKDWERDYKQAAKDGHNIFRHWFTWNAINYAGKKPHLQVPFNSGIVARISANEEGTYLWLLNIISCDQEVIVYLNGDEFNVRGVKFIEEKQQMFP